MMRRTFPRILGLPSGTFANSARKSKIDEVLRVDQAGETAAVRICGYQLLWMSPLDSAVPVVKEILKDELVHEKTMNDLAKKHSVRLTALDPVFHVGGFAMATLTALLGKEAMMCCHAAVEITIVNHYNDQLRELEELENGGVTLNDDDAKAFKEIKDIVAKFRDEEEHHQRLGETNGAAQAFCYPLLYNGIRLACRMGVNFAKKV
ncbi:ubiquinone biosynthesis protein COQ7, putative [Trypanosoma cruzi]|uniref:Putative ubiquinone biosynthesis protein COQ7 n=1 Tax=Trypanosoma cruzi TaxID=5693 RepID=A0A2V2VIX0_TRYCR|nr:ubiquinone biosynthesis protein COQ7, putative [Trypanosoma cruzi]KAF8276508.1 putative ubiquinone biosynthesis protein COQ7-like [Trypanosoma cruzi]PBJ72670.1 ubiquinone biosynthesis protein COQ7-like protein [Trypanosoma cruzi cruzi]PWU95208.1 putative ubiquinone biosynthesis protein COQ7 [Trypanosoma cruzi]